MQIHGTDVAATLLIAAGIVTAHTITDILFTPFEYTTTIWVDRDVDPFERMRVTPRPPLPPAPAPLIRLRDAPEIRFQPNRFETTKHFHFVPLNPQVAQLDVVFADDWEQVRFRGQQSVRPAVVRLPSRVRMEEELREARMRALARARKP